MNSADANMPENIRSGLAQSRRSIAAGFLGLGLFMGMWGVMVPARSAALNLTELMISGFLLCIGLSLCAAIYAINKLPILQNAPRLIRYSAPIYAFGFAVCLTTDTLAVFFGLGIITGFAAGLIDAGLNGQASQWEQLADKRAMSFFHGLWSLGVLGGASLTTVSLSAGLDLETVAFGCALTFGTFMVARRSWITSGKPDPTENSERADSHSQSFSLPMPLVMLLGLCILLATLTEGGILDWSALHLNRYAGLDVDEAGQAVIWFSVAMTISRFSGDWLANRIAPHLLLAVPMLGAALLLGLAALSSMVGPLIVAYVLTGLALGNAFPIVVSEAGKAAGDRPLRDISVIVAFAYFGLISGPALLGLLAHMLSLNAIIYALALFGLMLGIATFNLPRMLSLAQKDD